MKNLIAVGLLVGFVGVGYADTSKNPDRYFSLGLDFNQSQVGLTGPLESFYDSTDNSTTYIHSLTTLQRTDMTVDARVPVSNTVTFSLHGGPSSVSSWGESHTGYSVGGGLRVYFPSLSN